VRDERAPAVKVGGAVTSGFATESRLRPSGDRFE
jgi:hypothetical protein